MNPAVWGRLYFATQSAGGALWWAAVFLSAEVRQLTLGSLDPVVVAVADIPLFVVASALAATGRRWAVYVSTVWTIVVTIALAISATITSEAGVGALLMVGAAAGSVVAACLVLVGRIPTRWIAIGPFRFSPADAQAGRSRHLVLTAVEIVAFWAVFLGVLPLAIAVIEDRWQVRVLVPWNGAPAGVVLFVLGGALGVWSGVVMSSRGGGTPLPAMMPNRLVIAGPYRFVRNPMAVGSIAQGVAVGILLSSWLVVAYAIAGAVLWHVVVRPEEETDLEARYGDAFRSYRTQVRCWWPRMTPFDLA